MKLKSIYNKTKTDKLFLSSELLIIVTKPNVKVLANQSKKVIEH